MNSTGLNDGNRTSCNYGERDILMGRGGSVNRHSGNKVFRRFIEYKKEHYKSLPKDAKPLLIDSVLQALENQGARFLKKDEETGMWYEVDRSDAFAKTSQALREGPRKGRSQDPAKQKCKQLTTGGLAAKTHGGVVTPPDASGSDISLYDPIALTSVDQPEYCYSAEYHYLPQPHAQYSYHAEAHVRNPSIRSHRPVDQERVDVAGYMQDFFYSEPLPASQQHPDVHRQFSNTFSIAEMTREISNEDEMSGLLLSRVESASGGGLDISVAPIPAGGLTRQTTDILQLMRDFQNNESLNTRDAHTSV